MARATKNISNDYPNSLHKVIQEKIGAYDFMPTDNLLDHHLKMTRYRFWRIYRCEQSPTLSEALRFCEWLNVELEELFPNLPKNKKQSA